MIERLARAFARARPQAAAVIALVTFLAGIGLGRGSRTADPELALLLEAHGRLRELALRPPDGSEASREAIQGMLEALDDPFAEYLPRKGGKRSRDPLEERALGLQVGARKDVAGVSGRMLSPTAGYVALKLFAPDSGGLVRAEVRRLKGLGATGVVLDLRGNPGGLVEEALDVAGIFLGRRTVFRYETAGGGEGERSGRGTPIDGLGLTVLVDGRTASAGELVAGAVQDAGRGLVVGERTKGKASVQKVVELSDGSAIKFTTAVYRTPKGRRVAGKGITPDVVLERGSGDAQLARAEAILRATGR